MNLPSFAMPPRTPYNLTPKPQILYVADVPEWSFDRKGQDYRKHIPNLDIDIGYANTICMELGMADRYYRNMEKAKHYDVIWHLHDKYIWHEEEIVAYVKHHNKNNTGVILTINQYYNNEQIEERRNFLKAYNAISVNSPYCYFNLVNAGFKVDYTPDGFPGEIFAPDTRIESRPFNVLFISSQVWMEHKGYPIWCEVRDELEPHNIGFIEVVVDSFHNKLSFQQMNDIYNRSQVFCCMSRSEGGPCTLQESAACGVVPICTRVGYTEYLKNIFIVERNKQAFIDKILYLKDNPKVVKAMSRGLIREAYHWQSCFAAQRWGYFAEKEVLRRRGLFVG